MTEPLILFAHGSGVPPEHPWMQRWAERLGALGTVERFAYPYMAAGRRLPDRLPKLLDCHRAALADASADHAGPVLLAGKSMGSRVGCHLANEVDVDAVICLGYPLVSQSGKLRDQVLLAARQPMLFVQGTRDRLCPLDTLATVRERMTAPSELYVVDGGDHSLEVGKRALAAQGLDQDGVDSLAFAAIQRFVSSVLQSAPDDGDRMTATG